MGVIQAPRRIAEIGERALGELLEVLSNAKARKADLDKVLRHETRPTRRSGATMKRLPRPSKSRRRRRPNTRRS